MKNVRVGMYLFITGLIELISDKTKKIKCNKCKGMVCVLHAGLCCGCADDKLELETGCRFGLVACSHKDCNKKGLN
jgi:hypothetical protein